MTTATYDIDRLIIHWRRVELCCSITGAHVRRWRAQCFIEALEAIRGLDPE